MNKSRITTLAVAAILSFCAVGPASVTASACTNKSLSGYYGFTIQGTKLGGLGFTGQQVGVAMAQFYGDGTFTQIDTVTIAGVNGVVEALTLRKTTVRDGNGTLYIIPNSQITTVANLSAGYSVAMIHVSVDFSANPDEVQALLTTVAMDVRNSKEFKDMFVADPQVLGIDVVKGSQMIYLVNFKTRATQQYAPMREFQRRVRLALEEHHMLPGDPNRVFTPPGRAGSSSAEASSAVQNQESEPEHSAQDPTTLKPQEINPFSGE